LWAASCARAPEKAAPADLAFVAFENQSGDASLDWLTAAGPAYLAAQTGARTVTPFAREALLSGATRLAYGSITREKGQIRLAVELHAAPETKRRAAIELLSSEAELPQKLAQIAAAVSTATRSLPVKVETLRLWAQSLSASSGVDVIRSCEQILATEATFAPAVVSCLNSLQARAELPALSAYLDRAKLAPESLTPAEALAVAQVAFNLGRFEASKPFYRRAAPETPLAWNQLGYAESATGRLEAAVQALTEYRKSPGQEQNALDSLGEVHFFAGKYDDAERFFAEAAQKYPQATPSLYKAALSRLVTGDRQGATKLFGQYLAALRKANDPAVNAAEGQWQRILTFAQQRGNEETRRAIEDSYIRRPRAVTLPGPTPRP
jgi:tetratricopeptide (TPR) repeat protein